MQRIAVLTSGGDAPGMNAAIRAVTRSALARKWEVFGIQRGYAGLIEDPFVPLDARTVGGIIQRGGTVLGSARCEAFRTEEGRKAALRRLGLRGIEGLVVIGGNGSQTGAAALHALGLPVVGVASTIDNDLIGSDVTLGVDTALNIALEAIDRLKTTASSHRRAFLVEVMGRDCGYLALMAGLAGGAEAVAIPEIETTPDQVAQALRAGYERGKTNGIAVVAEGARHNAEALVAYFREHHAEIGFELRATILGHVQRGGAPTAYDRLLGTRLGAGAVEALACGEAGVVVGMLGGRVATTPYAEVVGRQKAIDPALFELTRMLEL
jgi:6-phosphofructokinase 1